MIYYNLNTINDWNFGDDNIIKVYRNGAVVFYKFDSEQGGYKVCFAVVDDIAKYTDREYEDVYDKATEKWFKLNNINQYEEYGVYASGRTSCEGSSRLPQGYTEVEYVENTGTSTSNGAYLNLGLPLYDTIGNSFVISSRLKSEYYSASGYDDLETIINSESVSSPYYGFTYRYAHSTHTIEVSCNPSNSVSLSSTANSDGSNSIVISCNSTTVTDQVPLGLFASYNANYNTPYRFAKATIYSLTVVKNGDTVRDLVPAKRDSDDKYGMYDLITDTFYTSPNGNNFIGGEPITPTDCVTTYNGKLTIDDGYEYEWNGSSWVNLGEVSGSSRVPYGYTELTYCTVPKQSTEKFVVPYELQPYYKYSMEFTPLDFWTSSYYAMLCADYSSSNNLQLFKLDNGWGTQWRRFENKFENYVFDTRAGKPFQDKYTVFENVKAKISFNLSGYTIGQGAVITVENEGSSAYTGVSTTTASSSYNPTYGIRTMYMMCGEENQYGKTPNMKFHNFKVETSGGTAIYDYIPTKRDSDNKVGIYDVVHNEFYVPSALTLTAGDEASHTEYPKYYSEKSEPLDNLTFNTLAEAQAYAEANCVYDGMHATIGADRYYFDSSDENGWTKVTEYYIVEDVTPNAASGWTISGSATYNPDSSYYDDFDLETTSTSYATKIAKVTIYGYDHFTYYLRSYNQYSSSYAYVMATNVDEVSTPPSTMSYSSSSAITNTYNWGKSPKSTVNLSNYRRVTYNNLDKTVEHTFYVYFYGRTYLSNVGNATILIPKEQTNENWEQVTFSASSNVSTTNKNLYIDGNYSTSGGTQYFYYRWMVGLPSGSHSSYVGYSNYNYCPNVTSSTFTSVASEQRQVNFTYDDTSSKSLSFRLTDGSNILTPSDTVYYNMTYYNSCGASSSSSNVTFPMSNTVKVGGRFRFANSSNRHYIYGYSPNISLYTNYYVDNYQSTFDITYTKLSEESVTITYTTYDPSDVETPAFKTDITYPYSGGTTSSTTLTSFDVPYTYPYEVSQTSDKFSADSQSYTANQAARTINFVLYPNNREFATVADLEAYQYAWEGMKATVGDTKYQYKNGEWVENQHSLPDVPFTVNYNAKQYNASTKTLLKTEGQLADVDAVITGGTPTVNDGYLTIASSTRATISGYQNYFNRSNSTPNLTIISKQRTDGSNGHMFANRDSNYNWMYRCYSNKLTLHGTSEQGYVAVTTQPVIESVRINSSRLLTYNNYTNNTSSTYSSFNYGGTNSGKFALFAGYASNTGEWFVGDFYWVYMCQGTLTDEQVQQVIDYNENL